MDLESRRSLPKNASLFSREVLTVTDKLICVSYEVATRGRFRVHCTNSGAEALRYKPGQENRYHRITVSNLLPETEYEVTAFLNDTPVDSVRLRTLPAIPTTNVDRFAVVFYQSAVNDILRQRVFKNILHGRSVAARLDEVQRFQTAKMMPEAVIKLSDMAEYLIIKGPADNRGFL